MNYILEIKDLHTYFYKEGAVIKAVEGLTLSVKEGEVLGLVGESACGKTITAHSVMGLVPAPGRIVKGEVIFEGNNLLALSPKAMRQVRGSKISMVFQEPGAALNPLYTVGFQIEEMIKVHKQDASPAHRRHVVLDLLRKVGIPQAHLRISAYPHSLSGGQAQRVVIAMALSCGPKLVIADEPTTSLDVTIQAQIMDLFLRLKKESAFTLVLITHNLALCAQIADRLAIMYAGRVVEVASKEEIFANPLHPYTRALFSSLPQGEPKGRLKVIEGVVPDPAAKPGGCHFHPRCPVRKARCSKEYPCFAEVRPGHSVSCFRAK